MNRQRKILLGLLLVLALALVAAGCGGDDDEEAGGTTATTEETTEEQVSGSVSVMGIWVGEEQKSFQAVIDGFKEQQPDVTVKYNPVGDNLPTVLGTAVQGGNPPDVAAIAQPGLMTQFVEQGELKPLDFAEDAVVENFGQSVVETGSVEDSFYGLLWKANNASTIWYNVKAFEDAGLEPPETWDELLEGAETIKASGAAGVLDRRSGRLDAHGPLREHLPAHRGPREVRPALEARDQVDRPVGQRGADRDGEGLQRKRQPGGRHSGSPPDGLPHLRQQCPCHRIRRRRWSSRPTSSPASSRRRSRRRRATTSSRSRRSTTRRRPWSRRAIW